MAQMNNCFLSVCIPTYNGEDRISFCLDSLLKARKNNVDVEIIVSDNCSSDRTREIVEKYLVFPNFYYYRNNENLGFNGNIRLLIDNYSKGEYCWIIGDDDLVDIDVFDNILPMLKDIKPPFVSIKHRVLSLSEIKNSQQRAPFIYKVCSFFQCLDLIVSDSNVLGTFMSTHIFLLDRIKLFDKSSIGDNDWTDFRTTFPNSYMMTQTFHKEQCCCCVITPLITALSHVKSWEDKMYNIRTKVLPDYYDFCLSLVDKKSELSNTRRVINEGIIFQTLLDIKEKKYKRVTWRLLFSYQFVRYLVKRLLR